MSTYNGHRNWNAWNVSLWINNDEGLYRFAVSLAKQFGIGVGAVKLTHALRGEKTPDGATYNLTCVRDAMRGIL
jgi:hypothetical protein